MLRSVATGHPPWLVTAPIPLRTGQPTSCCVLSCSLAAIHCQDGFVGGETLKIGLLHWMNAFPYWHFHRINSKRAYCNTACCSERASENSTTLFGFYALVCRVGVMACFQEGKELQQVGCSDDVIVIALFYFRGTNASEKPPNELVYIYTLKKFKFKSFYFQICVQWCKVGTRIYEPVVQSESTIAS